jgi:hypothetical protein
MIIPLVTQIGFNTNLLFCSHVLRCRAFHSFQLWYCYLCFVREYYLLFGVVCSVTSKGKYGEVNSRHHWDLPSRDSRWSVV